MKTTLIIMLSLISNFALAEEKSYESYNEIVDRLSAQRNQVVQTKKSITLPADDRFQMIFGLSNSSTTIDHSNVGTVSQNGFLFGAAVPVLDNVMYAEGFAKFFKAAREGNSATSLRQFELRISHKEPLTFAIWNLGLGTSLRFMNVEAASGSKDINVPGLIVTTGLERRVSERLSVAGDLGYHRALDSGENAQNAVEFIVRMNYFL